MLFLYIFIKFNLTLFLFDYYSKIETITKAKDNNNYFAKYLIFTIILFVISIITDIIFIKDILILFSDLIILLPCLIFGIFNTKNNLKNK